jgi:hypothetical protein
MDEAGVAGAALIVTNKTTGTVDEAVFCGLSAEFKHRYVDRYAALDPSSPLLDVRWIMLSRWRARKPAPSPCEARTMPPKTRPEPEYRCECRSCGRKPASDVP